MERHHRELAPRNPLFTMIVQPLVDNARFAKLFIVVAALTFACNLNDEEHLNNVDSSISRANEDNGQNAAINGSETSKCTGCNESYFCSNSGKCIPIGKCIDDADCTCEHSECNEESQICVSTEGRNKCEMCNNADFCSSTGRCIPAGLCMIDADCVCGMICETVRKRCIDMSMICWAIKIEKGTEGQVNAGILPSCEFALDNTDVSLTDINMFEVFLDDISVPWSDKDGWNFNGVERKVVLTGSFCETWLNETVTSFQMDKRCQY